MAFAVGVLWIFSFTTQFTCPRLHVGGVRWRAWGGHLADDNISHLQNVGSDRRANQKFPCIILLHTPLRELYRCNSPLFEADIPTDKLPDI